MRAVMAPGTTTSGTAGSNLHGQSSAKRAARLGQLQAQPGKPVALGGRATAGGGQNARCVRGTAARQHGGEPEARNRDDDVQHRISVARIPVAASGGEDLGSDEYTP